MLSFFFDGLYVRFIDLLLGFAILIKGADFLIGGASSLAKRNGISNLAIGLTVVAFGTSMPELIVSLMSAVKGKSDAAFGNVMGSNNFNLLFILGACGLIYPLIVQRNTVKFEVPISLFAAAILYVLVNDTLLWGSAANTLSRQDSIILLICFGGFLLYIFRTMKKAAEFTTPDDIKLHPTGISLLLVVAGMGMLAGGGSVAVTSATEIAAYFGLSEKLIGLTILAVGTSLPELATSAMAAFKKNTDIAIGNVIGSNIFNLLFILGVTGVINPMAYNPHLNFDLTIVLIATLVLMIFMFTINRRKLDRFEAFLLFFSYIAYSIYLISAE
ncbi:MAG: calcium/sodium antiporter [Cytophagales bacterium]|nr:calcium/sodium antiporter [Cytophagales bacterium]